MATVSDRSTAMLIVKVWREEASFRATLAWSADTSRSRRERTAAASPEDVLSIVGRWLRDL